MGDQRFPKITLKSSQDHVRLKRGWYEDTIAWVNQWGIDENATLSITSKILLPLI